MNQHVMAWTASGVSTNEQISRLNELFGVTIGRSTFNEHKRRLNINRKRIDWNKRQDVEEFVINHFGKKKPAWIASQITERFGMPMKEWDIRNWASRRGNKSGEISDEVTISDAAKFFGVISDTIQANITRLKIPKKGKGFNKFLSVKDFESLCAFRSVEPPTVHTERLHSGKAVVAKVGLRAVCVRYKPTYLFPWRNGSKKAFKRLNLIGEIVGHGPGFYEVKTGFGVVRVARSLVLEAPSEEICLRKA